MHDQQKEKISHEKLYNTHHGHTISKAHTVPYARVGPLSKDSTPHGILKVHEYEHKEPMQSTSNKKYFCIFLFSKKKNERQKQEKQKKQKYNNWNKTSTQTKRNKTN